MNPTVVFWVAGFLAHAVLCFVLLRKGGFRSFPIFTGWIAFMLVRSIVLFIVSHWFGVRAYYNVYWSAVIPDYILQVGVLYEICRNVINAYRRSFPKTALYALGALVVLGSAASVSLATMVDMAALQVGYAAILRLNLGFSLVRCAVFAAITLFADALGLNWRHHVQRLATGLAIYSLADLSTDAIRIFVQPGSMSDHALGYVGSAAYLTAVAVWTFSFFQEEPVRGTLSPAAEVFIGNLHRKFSLGRRNL